MEKEVEAVTGGGSFLNNKVWGWKWKQIKHKNIFSTKALTFHQHHYNWEVLFLKMLSATVHLIYIWIIGSSLLLALALIKLQNTCWKKVEQKNAWTTQHMLYYWKAEGSQKLYVHANFWCTCKFSFFPFFTTPHTFLDL